MTFFLLFIPVLLYILLILFLVRDRTYINQTKVHPQPQCTQIVPHPAPKTLHLLATYFIIQQWRLDKVVHENGQNYYWLSLNRNTPTSFYIYFVVEPRDYETKISWKIYSKNAFIFNLWIKQEETRIGYELEMYLA